MTAVVCTLRCVTLSRTRSLSLALVVQHGSVCKLKYQAVPNAAFTLHVAVYDEDIGSDDLVGGGQLSVSERIGVKLPTEILSVPLHSSLQPGKGGPAGTLRISVESVLLADPSVGGCARVLDGGLC